MEYHYFWQVFSYQSAPNPNIDLPGHRYSPERSLFFPWVGASGRRGGSQGDRNWRPLSFHEQALPTGVAFWG